MNAVTETQYLQAPLGLAAIAPDFQQLTLEYDFDTRSAWTRLKPHGRACFTLGLLSELARRDKHFRANRHQGWAQDQVFPIEYQVVASGHPGVFNFGGDLALFVMLIKARDRQALLDYARACVEPAWQRLNHYDGSATTISLVEGDALGGGFEAALTSDIIIAEDQARMGFPEILFNLFPGMGAYSILSRRLSPRVAEKLMSSGELHSAEELKFMGVVDVVVPRGEGRKATFEFMAENRKRANGMHGVFRCREFTNPVSMEELMGICGAWADAALHLEDRDLRMMQRLVRAQLRQQYEDRQANAKESGSETVSSSEMLNRQSVGHDTELQLAGAKSAPLHVQVGHPLPDQVEVELR